MWPIPFIQPVFEYSVYQNRHFNSYDQWTNQTSTLFSLLRGIHFKYFLGRITVYNCNLAFCIIILLFKYYNLTNSTQSPVCLPVPLRVTAHSLDVASRGCFTLCKCQTEMPTSIKGDVRPPGMWLISVMSIWNRISKRNFLQELGFWLSLTWYPLVCSVCLHSCAAAAGQYSYYTDMCRSVSAAGWKNRKLDIRVISTSEEWNTLMEDKWRDKYDKENSTDKIRCYSLYSNNYFSVEIKAQSAEYWRLNVWFICGVWTQHSFTGWSNSFMSLHPLS